MIQYDAIVIGAGQAGTPLAKKLAKAGMKTALIEKRWIGGVCVNDGCTPTKTMIASAKAAYMARNSADMGVRAEGVTVDIDKILERKQDIVLQFRNGSVKGLEKTEGVTIIYGTASFTGEKEILVKGNDGTEQTLTAEKIFINTGTRPVIPDVAGLEETGYYTATTLMELKEIPKHLLIIGAGYIGMEFGQMYQRFGSQVTMLESNDRLLSREDEDIVGEIEKILTDEGVQLLTNANLQHVSKRGDDIEASVNVDGKDTIINCTHILVAAGRKPNTDELNAADAGIGLNDRGYIKVNERLEANVPGIYALGDVNGGPQFTHISYHDYIIVTKNLLENSNESTDKRMMPYCMFTDPQLGRVGLSEQEARKKGLNIKVATLPMAHVARAIETGDTRGMMKAVVDADNGQILGVAILGAEGGEVMTVLQMAMMGGITHDIIRNTAMAHPLFSESLNNLFMKLDK